MNDNSKLYTVKWPKATEHHTKSQSGVMVESNLQGQIALHFYNETRELEEQVQYTIDGNRTSNPRDIVYVREHFDTLSCIVWLRCAICNETWCVITCFCLSHAI